MTKKKPDFLRDLDTAIMDELTGGGIKGNAAGLVGTLTQIKEIKQLCGLPFCGYMAKLETVRPSGVPDEATVVFAEDVPYRACNGIEFDVMQEFVEGSRLLLTGKVQTLKDFQSGRLLVYILADFVAVSEKAVEQDEAAVRGVIANKPTYRETPRGKRITDITVKVRNELTGGNCFLPCICWQEQADEAAQWQQGDTVELLGRYQSRQYEKVLDAATGEREQRTAYEVSVRLIRRKRQKMSVEHIGKGYVKICVSEEELENSIAGLSQLKPILQTQVIKGNGRNTKQGIIDAAELGKHFDTAIDAMTMLLAGFKEESEAQNKE